jgi:hypothetical protein
MQEKLSPKQPAFETRKPIFFLTQTNINKANAWISHHNQEHCELGQSYRQLGVTSGVYTWEFTPTGIGTVVKVKCNCGESIDLSDYDLW